MTYTLFTLFTASELLKNLTNLKVSVKYCEHQSKIRNLRLDAYNT